MARESGQLTFYNRRAMASLHPFRALRPHPARAAAVAAVPYDVVSAAEARTLADANPLSFLRVSRAEIELPQTTDPYAGVVYSTATGNFAREDLRACNPDALFGDLSDTAAVVEAILNA